MKKLFYILMVAGLFSEVHLVRVMSPHQISLRPKHQITEVMTMTVKMRIMILKIPILPKEIFLLSITVIRTTRILLLRIC